jgi:hypothetical protein
MKLSLGAALSFLSILAGCSSSPASDASASEVNVAPSELLTLEGEFAYVTDTFGLRTATASEVLELHDKTALFTQGEQVRVRGYRKGNAIDVVDLVLCPRPMIGGDLAPIDCTTGPEHDEPEVCSNGDAKWLETNCRGVVVFF